MGSPAVTYQRHLVPRAESGPDEGEDAARVRTDAWPVRAAVADGATESVYAGLWAQMLVETLVDAGTDSEAVVDAVQERQPAWADAVQERAAERPWYVQAKAEEGAFATGLVLSVHDDGTWTAASIGDCCLVHVRNEAVRAWPADEPEAYTHRPALIPSRGADRIPTPDTTTGDWTPGDAFLLATDAVAAWLLRVGPRPLLDADEPFEAAVDAARDDGTLRNDDATLLILKMTDPPEDDDPSSDRD